MAACGGNEHSIRAVAERRRGGERRDATERVVRSKETGGIFEHDAVQAVRGINVAQRNWTAHDGVCGIAFDHHAIKCVAYRRAVIGAQAEEIALNRRIIGIRHAQPIAAVAADHVVIHKRILHECAADERIAVSILNGHAIQLVPQRSIACASVPMKLPLN